MQRYAWLKTPAVAAPRASQWRDWGGGESKFDFDSIVLLTALGVNW